MQSQVLKEEQHAHQGKPEHLRDPEGGEQKPCLPHSERRGRSRIHCIDSNKYSNASICWFQEAEITKGVEFYFSLVDFRVGSFFSPGLIHRLNATPIFKFRPFELPLD